MDGSQSTPSAEIHLRRFSAAEVQAMLDAGVLRQDEKLELIDGQLIQKPRPMGRSCWGAIFSLTKWFRNHLPRNLTYASMGPLRLGEFDEPEPEIFVFPDDVPVNDVRGEDVVLVIEVAESTQALDLGMKAALYAQYKVREYWVVDVQAECTYVHTLSEKGNYACPTRVRFDDWLTTPGDSDLAIAGFGS